MSPLRSCCVLLVVAAALSSTTHAAVIPNLMFARSLNNAHHPESQWRAAAPMIERPVYGIPHRYLSDPVPAPSSSYYSEPGAEDIYSDPLFRHPSWKRNSNSFYSAPAAAVNYYDLMADDPIPSRSRISPQDVVNFEKYVQRYFEQDEEAGGDEDEEREDSEMAYDQEDEEVEGAEQVDNDEEAARQLHLLLQQQQRPNSRPAVREIQKKSLTTTTTTTSTTPAPTQETNNKAAGQKEEAMLRPPTQQPPTMTPSTETKPMGTGSKEATKEEDDIYQTIHRLMAMRNQLDDKQQEEQAMRMKRFVAPSQDSLGKELHSLDAKKIKA